MATRLRRPGTRGTAYWAGSAFAAVLVAVLHFLVRADDEGWMTDLRVYLDGAHLPATALYTTPLGPFGLLFQYPPVAADLFALLPRDTPDAVAVGWNAVSLLALQAAVWSCLRLAGAGRRARAVAALAAAVASPLLEPVENSLFVGQLNLVLMALVACDLALLPRRAQGVGIGLATALKLIPGVFVVFLLATRRFRAAATALGCFTAISAVELVRRPVETAHFWATLGITPRGEAPENLFSRSAWSALVRATHGRADLAVLRTVLFGLIAVLVVLLVAAIHRRTRSTSDAVVAPLLAWALAADLLAPVAWAHYWVWIAPTLVLCCRWAWTLRSPGWGAVLAAVVAAFTARSQWWEVTPYREALALSPVELLETSALPAATALLLAAMAWAAGRAPVHPAPADAAPACA